MNYYTRIKKKKDPKIKALKEKECLFCSLFIANKPAHERLKRDRKSVV